MVKLPNVNFFTRKSKGTQILKMANQIIAGI